MIDSKSILRLVVLLGHLALASGGVLAAQTIVGNLSLGDGPVAAAVDPVRSKVYVANTNSNNVSVLDEFAGSATNVSVGSAPSALAVNPATGKVYVANEADGTVSVIDGLSGTVSATITAGRSPIAIAVNPATNQIYVANRDDNTVTLIDGTSGATSTVAVGSMPVALAVNPVDDMVYVANENSDNVTVLNGMDGATTTVAAGSAPSSIAVNPTTDVVYVVNKGDSTVIALNRSTGSTTTINVGSAPASIAINPVTNKIYVPSTQDGSVTVIDGATNSTTSIEVGVLPLAIAVNSITNKIYLPNGGGQGASGPNLVSVIDGVTNQVAEIGGSGSSVAIALDPKADRLYVPDMTANIAVVIEGATNNTALIATGPQPAAIAFNPVTKAAFICNLGSNSLTILDTISNTATSLQVGNAPYAVAVNPVTNRAYVANSTDGTVSVVDAAAKSVIATIPVGYSDSLAVAVNLVTNKIYVTVGEQNQVVVIDGASNSTAKVPVGNYPVAVAVNPITNTIYVANNVSNTTTIIDGETNATTTVNIGPDLQNVEVNPDTNKIYFGSGESTLVIMDGTTNQTTTLTITGGTGEAIYVAIDRRLNRIYATGGAPDRVNGVFAVIDGASDKILDSQIIPGGAKNIAVDPVSDLIYTIGDLTGDPKSGQVTAIDGVTKTPVTIPIGSLLSAIALDAVTGKVYLGNRGSNGVTVVTPNQLQTIPLTANVVGVVDNQTVSTTNLFQTKNPSPVFTAQVTSSYTSTPGESLTVNPPPTAVYFQVDGGTGPWNTAAISSPGGANPGIFNLCLSNISVGLHTLYLFPAYGDEAAGSGSGDGATASLQVGNIQGLTFLILPGGSSSPNSQAACASAQPPPISPRTTMTSLTSSVNPQVLGKSITFTASVSPLISSTTSPTGTVVFYDDVTSIGTAPVSSNLTATLTTSSLALGNHPISASYDGDANFDGSTSQVLVESIVQTLAVATTTAISSNTNPQVLGSTVIFTATVSASPAGSVAPTGTISFFDGTTELGTSTLGSSLTAIFTTASLALGSHSITASYGGDTNFAGSTSAVLVEIIEQPALIATATAVSSSANPQAVGSSVTFTATVSPSSSGSASPTGTVAFFDGTTNLGSSALGSSMTATFTASSLALGSHSITASYSGDAVFAGSTSAVLTESIVTSTASEDFSLTASPTSLTITSGENGTVTLSLAAISGFQGTVNLSCANLPTNVSCSFQSQTLTLNNSSSQSTILTLSATNQTAQLRNPAGKEQSPGRGAFLSACFFPACGLGMLLIVPTRKLHRRMTRLGALVVLLGVAFTIGGCGVTFNGYPETYSVVVSGSANGGQLTHQVTVALRVQN